MKLLYRRSGGVIQTCSARCYNAKINTRCFCICGGKLHAVGEQKALAAIRENRFTWGDAVITRRALRAIQRMKEREERTNAEA